MAYPARLLRRCPNLMTVLPKSIANKTAHLSMSAVAGEQKEPDFDVSAFSESEINDKNNEKKIHLKSNQATRDQNSVTMPMSFMTGSIVGKRFYGEVSTRMADDCNGWTVMLDYRTLKTPSKRPLKIQSLALAKAIAAEWEYQVTSQFLSPEFSPSRILSL